MPDASLLEANKTVVRNFIAATTAQDFDAYDSLLADNMVSTFPGGVILDREAAEAGERDFAVAFPDVDRVIEDLVAEGDRVVARTTVSGTHRGDFQGIAPTDRQVSTTAIVIYRVVDGRIVESWVEADFAGLIAQLTAS